MLFNPVPHEIISERSIWKAFADGKLTVTQKLAFVLERVENIVGKGENACYQHFHLFPQCLQSLLSQGHKKSSLHGKGLTHSHTMTPFDAPWKQAF